MKRGCIGASLLVVLLLGVGAPAVWAQDMEIGTAVATPTFDASFIDVSDYWSIDWDESWSVSDYQIVGDGELLQLKSEVWTVTFEGPIFNPKTTVGFARGDSLTALKDLISATGVSDQVLNPNGRPLRHYSSGRSWQVFNYQNQSYVFLDVRVLDDKGVFLYITAQMPADPALFNETYQEMIFLLDNIHLLR